MLLFLRFRDQQCCKLETKCLSSASQVMHYFLLLYVPYIVICILYPIKCKCIAQNERLKRKIVLFLCFLIYPLSSQEAMEQNMGRHSIGKQQDLTYTKFQEMQYLQQNSGVRCLIRSLRNLFFIIIPGFNDRELGNPLPYF